MNLVVAVVRKEEHPLLHNVFKDWFPRLYATCIDVISAGIGGGLIAEPIPFATKFVSCFSFLTRTSRNEHQCGAVMSRASHG